ncbi:MAG TPA: Wzz/FepE/Etk N-terminal domain-containing protein [Streptosporangiaceae bacterium]|jgi:capsular polysaccharide biosynthesis protein|nr:Wzz/FepE/Etk N-terminal domain-containing protein [Streptosporangiaceae bacterium]
MSQQALDLRRSSQIVRRHKVLVAVVAFLGILGGCGYAVLNPPKLTSTALVVLPQSAPSMATQVVIAESDPVLTKALPRISPALSLQQLRGDIHVNSLTNYVISFAAKGKTAAAAETIADAVAGSYIDYVGSVNGPIGYVPVRLLESAGSATGTKPVVSVLIAAVAGAVGGALAGIIIALFIGRGDRRLRERDELANALGVPVLASVPVDHPADAAAWTRLLESYRPGVVDAWRLRKAFQQLGVIGIVHDHDAAPGTADDVDIPSLAVLSLASDPGALALGPQLAVFAATLGVPTALIIGPQQDTAATATLRAVCAASAAAAAPRLPSKLRLIVADSGSLGEPLDATFLVVVIVVDGKNPRVPDTISTDTTVLGVSAGSATAEQLVLAAANAAIAGRETDGILLADPEPTDRTTGRVSYLPRKARRSRSVLRNGVISESSR